MPGLGGGGRRSPTVAAWKPLNKLRRAGAAAAALLGGVGLVLRVGAHPYAPVCVFLVFFCVYVVRLFLFLCSLASSFGARGIA